MAKVSRACTVCGKQAKREPIKAGYNLCKLHYQIKMREEAQKNDTTEQN